MEDLVLAVSLPFFFFVLFMVEPLRAWLFL